MSAEILAKLNPMSLQIGETFGGHSDFSPLDIAGALGMGRLSRPAYLMAMVKFVGRSEMLQELINIAYVHWLDIATQEGWKVGQLKGLVNAAVLDAVNWKICAKCNGVGFTRERKAKGENNCRGCKGTGRSLGSDTEKAKACGINRATFIRYWKARYELITEYLNGLIIKIENHLDRYYFRRRK